MMLAAVHRARFCILAFLTVLLSTASIALGQQVLTLTLLEPASCVRTTGAPNTCWFDFWGDIGKVTLTVTNGEASGARRVGSAVISLNGATIAPPSSLNANSSGFTIPIEVAAGNLLGVEMHGEPGGIVTVSVTEQIEVDQYLETDFNAPFGWGINSTQTIAQVITPGMTGSLVEVRLPVTCFETSLLTLEIQGVTDGLPNGTVLASQSTTGPYPWPLPPGGFAFRFDNPASVVAGTQVALVLPYTLGSPPHPVGSCGIMPGPVGNQYSGGDGYGSYFTPWLPLSLGTDRWDVGFLTIVK